MGFGFVRLILDLCFLFVGSGSNSQDSIFTYFPIDTPFENITAGVRFFREFNPIRFAGRQSGAANLIGFANIMFVQQLILLSFPY